MSHVDSPYLDFPAEEVSSVRPKTLPPIPRAARFDETPDMVIDCVAESYGVTRDDIKFGNKRTLLAEARAVTYWLLRTAALMSWPEIGRTMCKDHTCAISGNKNVARRRSAELAFLRFTDELAVAVKARLGSDAP